MDAHSSAGTAVDDSGTAQADEATLISDAYLFPFDSQDPSIAISTPYTAATHLHHHLSDLGLSPSRALPQLEQAAARIRTRYQRDLQYYRQTLLFLDPAASPLLDSVDGARKRWMALTDVDAWSLGANGAAVEAGAGSSRSAGGGEQPWREKAEEEEKTRDKLVERIRRVLVGLFRAGEDLSGVDWGGWKGSTTVQFLERLWAVVRWAGHLEAQGQPRVFHPRDPGGDGLLQPSERRSRLEYALRVAGRAYGTDGLKRCLTEVNKLAKYDERLGVVEPAQRVQTGSFQPPPPASDAPLHGGSTSAHFPLTTASTVAQLAAHSAASTSQPPPASKSASSNATPAPFATSYTSTSSNAVHGTSARQSRPPALASVGEEDPLSSQAQPPQLQPAASQGPSAGSSGVPGGESWKDLLNDSGGGTPEGQEGKEVVDEGGEVVPVRREDKDKVASAGDAGSRLGQHEEEDAHGAAIGGLENEFGADMPLPLNAAGGAAAAAVSGDGSAAATDIGAPSGNGEQLSAGADGGLSPAAVGDKVSVAETAATKGGSTAAKPPKPKRTRSYVPTLGDWDDSARKRKKAAAARARARPLVEEETDGGGLDGATDVEDAVEGAMSQQQQLGVEGAAIEDPRTTPSGGGDEGEGLSEYGGGEEEQYAATQDFPPDASLPDAVASLADAAAASLSDAADSRNPCPQASRAASATPSLSLPKALPGKGKARAVSPSSEAAPSSPTAPPLSRHPSRVDLDVFPFASSMLDPPQLVQAASEIREAQRSKLGLASREAQRDALLQLEQEELVDAVVVSQDLHTSSVYSMAEQFNSMYHRMYMKVVSAEEDKTQLLTELELERAKGQARQEEAEGGEEQPRAVHRAGSRPLRPLPLHLTPLPHLPNPFVCPSSAPSAPTHLPSPTSPRAPAARAPSAAHPPQPSPAANAADLPDAADGRVRKLERALAQERRRAELSEARERRFADEGGVLKGLVKMLLRKGGRIEGFELDELGDVRMNKVNNIPLPLRVSLPPQQQPGPSFVRPSPGPSTSKGASKAAAPPCDDDATRARAATSAAVAGTSTAYAAATSAAPQDPSILALTDPHLRTPPPPTPSPQRKLPTPFDASKLPTAASAPTFFTTTSTQHDPPLLLLDALFVLLTHSDTLTWLLQPEDDAEVVSPAKFDEILSGGLDWFFRSVEDWNFEDAMVENVAHMRPEVRQRVEPALLTKMREVQGWIQLEREDFPEADRQRIWRKEQEVYDVWRDWPEGRRLWDDAMITKRSPSPSNSPSQPQQVVAKSAAPSSSTHSSPSRRRPFSKSNRTTNSFGKQLQHQLEVAVSSAREEEQHNGERLRQVLPLSRLSGHLTPR
ncbi:hypothetical protein JCM6882_007371 [Rhodosporidiobolus microsporus]